MTFKKIVDAQLVASMGPPGAGGGNHITPRFVRFFNIIGVAEFDESTLARIFTVICNWYCANSGVAQDVKSVYNNVVEASLSVYLQAAAELRPTPLKSHYTFNLRDFSKTIQGMLMVKPYDGFDGKACVRLWVHEALRVFGDRLVDSEDQEIFLGIAKDVTKKIFTMKFDDLFANLATPGGGGEIGTTEVRSLLFGDYSVAGTQPENKIYQEVSLKPQELITLFDSYLEEYNAMSKSPMDLVMFLFAIEHTSRIARVLSMPGGNALLVGVGGSGRQSLTRLAAFMADYKIKQVELSKSFGFDDWRDVIKEVLREAGTGAQPYVFLFSDAQIKMEAFVEDINNLLNSAEVPNLFKADEKAEIIELMRGLCKNLTGANGKRLELNPLQLYARFVRRVKDQLHIVLAFSPIGSAFRDRLRKFPSLINCCTINWFFKWPGDALVAVAQKFLADVEFSDKIREEIVPLCQRIHTDVEALTDRFRSEVRRVNYVTPTSYLELIRSFKSALAIQRESVAGEKKRYEVGLEKLQFATVQVVTMQGELEAMGPILSAREKATAELMVVIAEKLPGATKMKEEVGAEANIVQIEVDKANTMKDECDRELAVAIPMLEEAVAALNTLKKAHIDEVKNFSIPPAGVVLVMGAVCDMLEIKPEKVPSPDDPTKKVISYWGPAKKLLATPGFLDTLKTYDKDNIDPKIIKKIQKQYINHEENGPNFEPERVKKASFAAMGLCKWVRAMEAYDRVAKVVAPKKIKLAQAEKDTSVLQGKLDLKLADLKVVEDELNDLNTKHEKAVKDKEETLAEVQLCKEKLVRATELIDGLGGEKTRWTQAAELLGVRFTNLTGDIAVSAGVIAYLGPFTSTFRDDCTTEWITGCKEREIPISDSASLTAILGDPVKIRQWNIQGMFLHISIYIQSIFSV
jgi:dynein heavy chain